jgi:hypothetical protein
VPQRCRRIVANCRRLISSFYWKENLISDFAAQIGNGIGIGTGIGIGVAVLTIFGTTQTRLAVIQKPLLCRKLACHHSAGRLSQKRRPHFVRATSTGNAHIRYGIRSRRYLKNWYITWSPPSGYLLRNANEETLFSVMLKTLRALC